VSGPTNGLSEKDRTKRGQANGGGQRQFGAWGRKIGLTGT
jgi:hypothetical protein